MEEIAQDYLLHSPPTKGRRGLGKGAQTTNLAKQQAAAKASKITKNLEYFKPIERKKHRRELGSSIQAVVIKKLKGTKDVAVPSDSIDTQKYGRIIFTGNVKKQRGNL